MVAKAKPRKPLGVLKLAAAVPGRASDDGCDFFARAVLQRVEFAITFLICSMGQREIV